MNQHTQCVLYCIISNCIALYCSILYCTVLYHIVLHYIVSYCIALYHIVLHCIVSKWHCTALHPIVLHCIVSYCIPLCCTLLLLYDMIQYNTQQSKQNVMPKPCIWIYAIGLKYVKGGSRSGRGRLSTCSDR